MPAAWKKFDSQWTAFIQEIGVNTWHHRDFCNRRRGYGALTDAQWMEAGDRLCKLLIDAQVFIAGAVIGRQTYNKAKAACDRICLHRKKINISTVLAGQTLGIKEVDEGIWLVSFMHYDLGYFDLEQKTLQPLDSPIGTRLSPMS
jgi:hypothetical protein